MIRRAVPVFVTMTMTMTMTMMMAVVGASSCIRKPADGGYVYRVDRRVILGSQVPEGFEKRERWAAGQKGLCPEGARLSPVMKYAFDPGERDFGHGFYFGRSCQQRLPHDEAPTRGLASVSPVQDEASDSEATYVPHGPFAYWWPNGRLMAEGQFTQGAHEGQWRQFDPQGKLVTAEVDSRYRAPLMLDTDE